MRSLVVVTVLTFAFLSTPVATLGQIPDSLRNRGSDMSDIGLALPLGVGVAIHPAPMAIGEWQRLGLSPEQVRQLRDAQDDMERAYLAFASAMRDALVYPLVLWETREISEAELRVVADRKARQEVEFMLQLLKARDQVFEVLTEEQAVQLRELYREELKKMRDQAMDEPERHLCTHGGAGGGASLSPKAKMVYSVTFEGDSARIDALFVARAEDRLRGVSQLPPRPDLPAHSLSGATAGRWYLMYDRKSGTAWIDDRAVGLHDDNVLLLHGIDSLHEPPSVVRTLRIPEMFYTGGCQDDQQWSDLLRDHVMGVAEIRSFVDG